MWWQNANILLSLPENGNLTFATKMPLTIGESVKRRIPWFVKIPAKIALSRLPVGARRWQDMNLFRAGPMDRPQYALDIFKKHHHAAGGIDLRGRTVLEIGPGNSLLMALFARSFGAARTLLVDSEVLTTPSLEVFVRAEQMLSELGLAVPGVSAERSLDGVLRKLNAVYLTDGLASMRTIADGTVDFVFSNAVLEHVRLAELPPLLRETRRVLKADGVSSHEIDFRDHLQNGLNNLRFSHRIWESEFMARSGFYTNRLTRPEMEKISRNAGFDVQAYSLVQWPSGLPTPQKSMAHPFREMPREELTTMIALLVLRPRREPD
jgi:SAM-dependent methyltransferase